MSAGQWQTWICAAEIGFEMRKEGAFRIAKHLDDRAKINQAHRRVIQKEILFSL